MEMNAVVPFGAIGQSSIESVCRWVGGEGESGADTPKFMFITPIEEHGAPNDVKSTEVHQTTHHLKKRCRREVSQCVTNRGIQGQLVLDIFSPFNLGAVELSGLAEYFPQLLRVSVGRVF